ncbi:hypothetical protein DPX16_19167 [Anabarilius grahami]|uniref:Uncharacterized protein n=1 Tax=Anabarilius grahami TaxID=495550 RepID=A0A3N0Z162_ANAGA|nr:hypothetical protein DPX16_19167 [Anabarilius grahami]
MAPAGHFNPADAYITALNEKSSQNGIHRHSLQAVPVSLSLLSLPGSRILDYRRVPFSGLDYPWFLIPAVALRHPVHHHSARHRFCTSQSLPQLSIWNRWPAWTADHVTPHSPQNRLWLQAEPGHRIQPHLLFVSPSPEGCKNSQRN